MSCNYRNRENVKKVQNEGLTIFNQCNLVYFDGRPHACAQTRLCPGTFVSIHDSAHTIVHIHDCAHIHNNNNSGDNTAGDS